MRRKRRPSVHRIPAEAVELYRHVRQLEAAGKGGGAVRYDSWSEEYRDIRHKLEFRLLGRRPWEYQVLQIDPDRGRPERDYVGRDWEGAVELRRRLDESAAS
jgi:hypothetical protein